MPQRADVAVGLKDFRSEIPRMAFVVSELACTPALSELESTDGQPVPLLKLGNLG